MTFSFWVRAQLAIVLCFGLTPGAARAFEDQSDWSSHTTQMDSEDSDVSPIVPDSETAPGPLPSTAPTSPEISKSSKSNDDADGVLPKIEEWKGKIGDSVLRASYSAVNSLSNMLWDRISDFDLESRRLGRIDQKIHLQRRIFDNHDFNNTYTVADRMLFSASVPIYSRTLIGGELGQGIAANLGFSIGSAEGLELVNIRQVRGETLKKLPSLHDLKAKVESSPWFIELKNAESEEKQDKPPTEDPATQADEPILSKNKSEDLAALDSLSLLDPLRKARYGQFFRIFSFPASIPLRVSGLSDLKDGEITSYNVYGSIQVGASIGWGRSLSHYFNHLGGSLSYNVYLRGDHRITIMKEDDRYVRVKVTRSVTQGHGGGLNASTDDRNVYSGFVILGQRVLRKQFHVVPFVIQVDHSNSEAFDVGYRYDLNEPEARKAYELATLGRFGYSDELAGHVGSESGKPVEKVFTRQQKVSTDSFTSGMQIASFFQHGVTTTYSDWDAVVTLPDGTRRIVSTDTLNSRYWKTFFGVYENTGYSFRVNVDMDRYEEGKKDALYLVSEATLEDSNTDGIELRAYSDVVEKAVGNPDLFPRMPIFKPEPEFPSANSDSVRMDYGYSNFYFRMIFNQEQVEKFMRYPADRMWTALEKAFQQDEGSWSSSGSRALYNLRHGPGMLANIPLGLFNLGFHESPKLVHANEILNLWLELGGETPIQEKVRTLGRLFRETLYSRELIALLRIVLEGQEISYSANGMNSSFGRIWKQGSMKVDFYPLPDRVNKEIDFDRLGERNYSDNAAVASKLSLEPADAKNFRLKFTAAAKPEALYIKVVEDGGWSMNKTLAEYVVGGGNYLKEGENEITWSERASEPWASLKQTIQRGKQYYITIAISKDGQTWGPLTTTSYFARGIY